MTTNPAMDDRYLDGNAAAGALATLFAAEMTTAVVTCAGCGRAGPLATLRCFGRAMGVVLRCPTCESTILRMTVINGECRLDLRGAVQLCCAADDR